jgi:hypothetical protein
MNIPNTAELARISAALIAAMSEARTMVESGNLGPVFAELVQHARDLHQMIGEELSIAGSAVGEYAGGLYAAMSDRLAELTANNAYGEICEAEEEAEPTQVISCAAAGSAVARRMLLTTGPGKLDRDLTAKLIH